MTAPGPVTPKVPFEPSQPPVIEGLNPLSAALQRASRKSSFTRHENPVVPIGCLGAVAALTYGARVPALSS